MSNRTIEIPENVHLVVNGHAILNCLDNMLYTYNSSEFAVGRLMLDCFVKSIFLTEDAILFKEDEEKR